MDQTIDLKLKKTGKVSAADRLLNAAGPLFADRPFDAVSTREIANAANVNLSAISYHFSSKEGLYEAVFKKLLDDLAPARQGVSTFLKASIGPAKNNVHIQREVIISFVDMFIEMITSDENPRWRMRLVIREIQQPGPCFDMVMEGHIDIVHDLIGQLVACITKQSPSSENVIISSQTIIGMCLQYGLNEALLSKRLGWTGFGSREIAIIKENTSASILALLGIGRSATKRESENTL
ncbi:MAG: CerR family C-terminal domain-containing protein [Sneathiella sp.]|nr:CerR family C-terminal domain-containing protein [Sneathiella sp.]